MKSDNEPTNSVTFTIVQGGSSFAVTVSMHVFSKNVNSEAWLCCFYINIAAPVLSRLRSGRRGVSGHVTAVLRDADHITFPLRACLRNNCMLLEASQFRYVHLITYLLTSLLTPWSRVLLEKLTGFAANQEIPRILWNPKVHYRTHKRPLPVPILNQISPVHVSPSNFFNVHLNIILPSVPRSCKWSLSVWFPSPNPCMNVSCHNMAHALRICVWYLEQYLVRNTDHKAPRYVIFSTVMLRRSV